jgi:putative SbcD/Mre11-related phosphoesterase
MDIQPIPDVPALTVGNTLVISDLHIGIETHLMKKGFHIVSRTEEMYDTIERISGDCNRLIVLGDVKDAVPGSSKQEYREIPDFFERLYEKFDIVDVVRGNHDTNIEEFLPPKVRIRPASGMVLDGVGYIHGHTWPSKDVMCCDTLVMAHNHPAVLFRDGVGKQMTEPCWLRGDFVSGNEEYETFPKHFIIVPAFNRMLGGSPVNVIGGKFLGPMMNSGMLDIDDAHAYLLDGIDLGKVSDIMVRDRISRFKDRDSD